MKEITVVIRKKQRNKKALPGCVFLFKRAKTSAILFCCFFADVSPCWCFFLLAAFLLAVFLLVVFS